jgi:hypothetical protein
VLRTRPPREWAETHPARLACIRHAASVDPEPGSNSPPICLPGSEDPRRTCLCFTHCKQGRGCPALPLPRFCCWLVGKQRHSPAPPSGVSRPLCTQHSSASLAPSSADYDPDQRPPQRPSAIRPRCQLVNVLPPPETVSADPWTPVGATCLAPNPIPRGTALSQEPAERSRPVPPCQGPSGSAPSAALHPRSGAWPRQPH